MLTNFAYAGAALVEIAGCFAFWAWLCLGHSPWWLVPGTLSLGLFACLLTLMDSDAAILWLWVVEHHWPNCWDIVGFVICLIGAGVILYGPRC